MKLIFSAFLIAFIASNLIVKYFGAPGLWISSALLIPFDFIARCIIHERLSGTKLILTLSILTVSASLATVLINRDASNIALASVVGFCAAQIAAGLVYQLGKVFDATYFSKVNGSDLVAIIFDSCLFQYVAFHNVQFEILLGQIAIKFAGGLLWYFILFKWLKIHHRINKKKVIKTLTQVKLHEVSVLPDGSYGIGCSYKKEDLK